MDLSTTAERQFLPEHSTHYGIDLARATSAYQRQYKNGAPDLKIIDSELNQFAVVRWLDNGRDHQFTVGVRIYDLKKLENNEKELLESFVVDRSGDLVMILKHVGGGNLGKFDDETVVEDYAQTFRRLVNDGKIDEKLDQVEAERAVKREAKLADKLARKENRKRKFGRLATRRDRHV